MCLDVHVPRIALLMTLCPEGLDIGGFRLPSMCYAYSLRWVYMQSAELLHARDK